MSRVQSTKSVASKKPYCKVCHDAGKPESEYTNHWVRSLPDRSGKTTVTCPTLLSTECRYCFKMGHTAKFCPTIEKNKKDKERMERKAQFEAVKPSAKVESKKPASVFAALAEDSDSDNEVTKPVAVEAFPALKKSVAVSLPKVQPEVKTGWAAALAKPKEDTYAKELEARSILKAVPQAALKPEPIVIKTLDALRSYDRPEVLTRNWADWSSDSDSEDEVEVSKPVATAGYDSDW